MTVSVEQKTVKTSVLNTAYLASGNPASQPLLLLHGFPYSPYEYDALTQHIHNEHPDKYYILAPFFRGFYPTTYLHADTLRSGQQAAIAQDILEFMDALSISRAVIVGYDWGSRAGCILSALHPDRVRALVTCNGYAIQDVSKAGLVPPAPEQVRRYWYQFYFNTEIGRTGLKQNGKDLCKLLWAEWSPNWAFTTEQYDKCAETFAGQDWVDTVIHSYRHRYGYVKGDQRYEEIEEKLTDEPHVKVPTVIVAGGSDGVQPNGPQDPKGTMFEAFYKRQIVGPAGHCVPAEAVKEVADAVELLMEKTQG